MAWSVASPIITAGADFADYHPYWDVTLAALEAVVFNAGGGASGTMDTPVYFGEMGVQNSTGTTAITNRYTALVMMTQQARVQGVTAWSITDFGGVNDWGFYAVTQDGSNAFTTPRSTQCGLLTTTPKVPQAYNAAQDTGAITPAAPSVPGVTPGTLGLSWSAATGGTAPYTYTREYAEVNANGFPVEVFQNGGTGSSTSGTITGLDADTDYVCRIATTDSTGVTRYSGWAQATTLVSVGSVGWRAC
jgi:hypothetical protein